MAENLAYALIQVFHNFGAVGLVALPAFALAFPIGPAGERRIALALIGLGLAQTATGMLFGAASLHFHGALPELHAVGQAALWTKVAGLGVALAAAGVLLVSGGRWRAARRVTTWKIAVSAAAAALAAAAFLRWYS